MNSYIIQEYNAEMTIQYVETNMAFEEEIDAIAEAWKTANREPARVAVLWKRSPLNRTRLVKIAKFY